MTRQFIPRALKMVVLAILGLAMLIVALSDPSSGGRVARAKDRKSDPMRERLARGRYLVEGPMLCFTCHSELDWKAPSAPVLPGKKGAGAKFPEEGTSFPVFAPNITPDRETGAGSWTDEQLARAIREGIGHDGRRLFPAMPYLNYRVLSDEDLASVVAYMRSIPPVHNVVPKTELPERVMNSLPPPMPITAPVPQPDFSNSIKRGEYLVQLGVCAGCHTPTDRQGRPLPGLDFAGGTPLKGPWGEVASTNITSDPSGISYYDRRLFLEVMRTGRVRTRQLNPIMPTSRYRYMTDEDLTAIYSYLRMLPQVSHRVDNTEPPRPCKRCGFVHGFGDRN
jgi:mono/diheme cytochrome c family protein